MCPDETRRARHHDPRGRSSSHGQAAGRAAVGACGIGGTAVPFRSAIRRSSEIWFAWTQDTEHRASFREGEHAMQAVTSDVKNGGSPHVVTLLGLSNDLLRRPWTMVALVLGCAIGSALVLLLQPRIFTASAAFVPETAVPLGEGVGVGLPAVSGLGSFG